VTLNGSRPISSTARRYGHQVLPVRETRTDQLRPQDTVLYDAKKYTVRHARREGARWNVCLEKDSALRSVTRPAGYVWPVLTD
jgi:hypothetical protein